MEAAAGLTPRGALPRSGSGLQPQLRACFPKIGEHRAAGEAGPGEVIEEDRLLISGDFLCD